MATSWPDRSALPFPDSFPQAEFPDLEIGELSNGIRLIVATRDAVPELVRSPRRPPIGRLVTTVARFGWAIAVWWLTHYMVHTPGVEVGNNGSVLLDDTSILMRCPFLNRFDVSHMSILNS